MNTWGIIISALPLIAGGFRLARFNVQLVGFSKSFFLGLPIPSSALTLASFVLAFYDDGYPNPISDFIIPMILVLAFLMVSNIRYETLPKFSLEGFKRKTLSLYIFNCICLACNIYVYAGNVSRFCFNDSDWYVSAYLQTDYITIRQLKKSLLLCSM